LGEDTLKSVLKSLAITETEVEVYLFLAKHGALKGTEVSRQLKKDKAQIYHILKCLQSKGLIEATLESPIRYMLVPFEKVIDQAIEEKRKEAQRIEKTKQEVLTYWKALNRNKTELQVEKFLVIEGRKKLDTKIMQMIAETQKQISAVATVQSMLRADQNGVYDVAFRHPLKHQIQFRFLTELSSKNIAGMKTVLKNMSRSGFNFRGRNPELGLHISQQLVLKDDDQLLLYINPKTNQSMREEEVCCLWTNCKSIVQTFKAIFEDMWENSNDIEKRIKEIETGKSTGEPYVVKDVKIALDKYNQALKSAELEVLMVTSSNGLKELDSTALGTWKEAGVTTRVMAPITSENFEFAKDISSYGEVRHVAEGLLETTILDGQHLFQFRSPAGDGKNFENVFYSSDAEYVQKTWAVLNELWKNAFAPSPITLQSITSAPISNESEHVVYKATKKMLNHIVTKDKEAEQDLTEKSVIEKIIKAQRSTPRTDIVVLYTTNGQAIIHPSSHLNMPVTLFQTWHIEKHSTYGAEDAMMVHLWLKTPQGEAFVLCGVITDNPNSLVFWKKSCGNTPAGTNIQLVKENEIETCIHGNTLFVGWTVQIPLLDGKYTIPPSCLQIEGFGKVKTNAYQIKVPSGCLLKTEGNILEAFVTYLHPTLKYYGPGTDGAIGRDVIMEIHPPKQEAISMGRRFFDA
jgi:sugar-specific transcriptional regulator TrmB